MSNLHRDLSESNLHNAKGFPTGVAQSICLRNERGIQSFERREQLPAAINFVDGTVAAPAVMPADIYVVIGSGTLHATWVANGVAFMQWARFQSGGWAAVTPIEGMTCINKATGMEMYFDGADWVSMGGGGGTDLGNILFVATTGDNSTGEKGNLAKPFLTLQAARDAASSGDVIHVLAGIYTISTDSNLATNGVNWYFNQGAVVNMTAGTNLFNKTGFTSGGNVYGYGVFNVTGGSILFLNGINSGEALTTVFEFDRCNSTVSDIFRSLDNLQIVYTRGNYAKTTAGNAFNVRLATWYHDVKDNISTTSAALSNIFTRDSKINASRIINESGGVAFQASSGNYVNLSANYVNRLSLTNLENAIINVNFCVVADVNANCRFNGYAQSFNYLGGNVDVKRGWILSVPADCASGTLNITLRNDLAGATTSILANTNQVYINLSVERNTGVDFNNFLRAVTVDGTKANVNILGDWRALNQNFVITNGFVTHHGNLLCAPNGGAQAPFRLNGGTLKIKGLVKLHQTTPIEGIIAYNGGKLILDGAVLIVNNQDQHIINSPNAVRDINCYAKGLSTNKLTPLGVFNQKIRFNVTNAAATSSITVNTVAFTAAIDTLANKALDLVTQINASVNVNIDGVITASQDNAGVDEYFYLTGDVAGVQILVSAFLNLVRQDIVYHTLGLTNAIGGTVISNTNIID
jgi:hypothetical protein